MKKLLSSLCLILLLLSSPAFAIDALLQKGEDMLLDDEPDYKEIERLFKLASQKGNAEASIALASLYKRHLVDAPSQETVQNLANLAIAQLKTAAERGDSRSALALSMLYKNGLFIPVDDVQHSYWLKKAAAAPDTPSTKLSLGLIAIWGVLPGYSQDDAVIMLQQAADEGENSAWLKLARAFSGAYGGRVDTARAKYAFRKAEQLGSVTAGDWIKKLESVE